MNDLSTPLSIISNMRGVEVEGVIISDSDLRALRFWWTGRAGYTLSARTVRDLI